MLRALPLLAAACSFTPQDLVLFDGDTPGVDAPEPKPDAAIDGLIDLDGPMIDASPFDAPPSCVRSPVYACGTPPEDLGTVDGDSGSAVITRVGNTDTYFFLRVNETSNSRNDPEVLLELDNPSTDQVDYDLHIYCDGCGVANPTGRSERPAGLDDAVVVYRDDGGSGGCCSDSFAVYIHVFRFGGDSCDDWTLTATANLGGSVTYVSCD